MQIVADWRDFEGDPITIVSAATDDTVGHTVATPDGKIEYSSNDEVKASTQEVTYKVTDGEDRGPGGHLRCQAARQRSPRSDTTDHAAGCRAR